MTKEIDTGGKAFPCYEFQQGYKQMMAVGGMTLRDYFAAKAMPEIMRSFYNDGIMCGDGDASQSVSYIAYVIADSMLEARK